MALCLVPLGGAGLFLGLSATTVKLLRYEGLQLLWVTPARIALLAGAALWCLYLGWRACRSLNVVQRLPALSGLGLCVGLVLTGWWLQFWGW